MPLLENIAIAYIQDQFKQIVEVHRFEPIDDTTAQSINAMMEAMLCKLLKQNSITDFQTNSSSITGTKIYTSVIFKLDDSSDFIYVDCSSHEEFIDEIVDPKVAFDRAMKGI